MDRLISFLALLPFLVYFVSPAFMLLASYLKRQELNKKFMKLWSVGFVLISILATFALMVISSQADLAFNSGRLFLTEPLVQISLASQIFGLFLVNRIFSLKNNEEWFSQILKLKISVGLITYLIFSNQFLSVFLGLITILVLAPSFKARTKQILSGVVFGGVVFLYFINLEFSKSFSELRLIQLSGDVNPWAGLALVFLILIFMLLTTLSVVSKNEKINFFDLSLWMLLSPIALIVCFYRMIQVGFISIDNIAYSFTQWFLVFYLLIFVAVLFLKKYSLKSLLLALSASHTVLALLFSIAGADDFTLPFSAVHFYVVSSIILASVLFLVSRLEELKGGEIEVSDITTLAKSNNGFAFITSLLILFASSLPPGPLFLVAVSGERSLIENGLYWSTLWSLIAVILLGYFLFTSLVKNENSSADDSKILGLWKNPEASLSLDFKEVIYFAVAFVVIYVVAFLNL